MTQALRENIEDLYPTRSAEDESWSERHDPVVWSDWNAAAPLTRAQADAFERDGYIMLENIFSSGELAILRNELDAIRGGGKRLTPDSVITEPGSDEIRTVFQLEKQSEVFDRLARDARIAGVIRFLLGDELYIHQSRLNYKPGFTGKEFYWHSDFETWHAEDGMPRMRAISASILLTDNDALNGPLMLMPGSHRTFVRCAGATPDDNHKTTLKKQEVGVPSNETLTRMAEKHGINYTAGKAGTVILFDCNTLHGSNGNITPFPRSNAFFVFNAWSNRPQRPFAAAKRRPEFLGARAPEAPIAIEHGGLA
jgi:ectoine hydroxylase